jgi:5-formyltetrahydrofolate cyclo-ligase
MVAPHPTFALSIQRACLMTTPALKSALRQMAVARRDGLEIDDRLEWDEAIAGHVLDLPELAAVVGVVAAYWPMRSEADPRPVMVGLAARGVTQALPAMVPGSAGFRTDIAFRQWAPWEPISPGSFGTLVPAEDAPDTEPSVLLVPLLAFDRAGRRLGYGKGHYDRAIARLRAQGPLLTVGVAYGAQEVDAVPVEAHDQVLDVIVTEDSVIRTGVSGGGAA